MNFGWCVRLVKERWDKWFCVPVAHLDPQIWCQGQVILANQQWVLRLVSRCDGDHDVEIPHDMVVITPPPLLPF